MQILVLLGTHAQPIAGGHSVKFNMGPFSSQPDIVRVEPVPDDSISRNASISWGAPQFSATAHEDISGDNVQLRYSVSLTVTNGGATACSCQVTCLSVVPY